MKKFSILIALMMVLAMAGSAFAAQATFTVSDGAYSVGTGVYNSSVNGYAYTKTFTADGKTNYPYEIYLPNEVNPAAYRIHSNYTKNTDACAACHATHTAVGNSLLQWYTVYDTCMACHDGTVTTTYNVEAGKIGATGKPAFGGMFGNGTEASASNHNVTGALAIAAAPGGSVQGVVVNTGSKDVTRWTTEFGCESCHTPHGQGGNARILSPDANGAATANKQATYYVSITGFVYSDAAYTNQVYIIKGYPYSPKVMQGGTTESVTLKIYNVLGVSQVIGGSIDAGTTITNGVAALSVKMDIKNYLNGATTGGETVTHISGMNSFCGACHTDYNTTGTINAEDNKVNSGAGSQETGTYSKAHRHQVGNFVGYFDLTGTTMPFENSKLECLTCHVAHGTSDDYWERTVGPSGTNYFTSTDDLLELAGSSALKRMPNMGTCEACHAKGDGNEGYSANTQGSGYLEDATTDNAANNVANLSVLNYWNLADSETDLAKLTDSASFLIGNGTGFFSNEKYVGSKACESCHADYYEGWNEEGHSDSFQTISDLKTRKDFDLAAEFQTWAGQGTKTFYNTSGVNVNVIFPDNTTMQYTVSGETYTINLSDIKYAWMEHYLLKNTASPTRGSEYTEIAQLNLDAPAGSPKIGPLQYYKSPYNAVGPSSVGWVDAYGDVKGCVSCHAPKLDLVSGTPDITIGCETCHGPATRHVSAPNRLNIFNPKTVTNDQNNALCATCHSARHNAIDQDQYTQSGHVAAGMTCNSCHDVHNTKKAGKFTSLKLPKDQLCASCHDAVFNVDAYFGQLAGENAVNMWARHAFDIPVDNSKTVNPMISTTGIGYVWTATGSSPTKSFTVPVKAGSLTGTAGYKVRVTTPFALTPLKVNNDTANGGNVTGSVSGNVYTATISSMKDVTLTFGFDAVGATNWSSGVQSYDKQFIVELLNPSGVVIKTITKSVYIQ